MLYRLKGSMNCSVLVRRTGILTSGCMSPGSTATTASIKSVLCAEALCTGHVQCIYLSINTKLRKGKLANRKEN